MDKEREELASQIHDIYIKEAKRQGDVRHKDRYEYLPENIKEFDRVLATFILEDRKRIVEPLVKELKLLKSYFENIREIVLHVNYIDCRAINETMKLSGVEYLWKPEKKN